MTIARFSCIFSSRWLGRLALSGFAAVIFASTCNPAWAAIVWDGEAGTQWWFDPVNWNFNSNANNVLPPGPTATTNGDAQINNGPGFLNLTSEGVVYDPANDPFFAAASSLSYQTGSPLVSVPTVMRDYGPETLYRMYIARNTTNSNLLTIKSGDLVIESTTIIGRSGSTGTDAGQQNLGRVNQTGGSVRLPIVNLDMGQRESSGWGNGTWDYRGGVLEVGLQSVYQGGNFGIRLSAGSTSNGPGGVGRLIMHNPESGGRVRVWDLTVSAFAGLAETPPVFNPALDPDGVTTGVGVAEFHFENGNVRPVQVLHNLSINNGVTDTTLGTRSSRLELTLDAAPTVNGGGVPQNLGLFDVDFDNDANGLITGTGSFATLFSNADGTHAYTEGDTVSAVFGNTTYNWKISYTGNISWTDADNSVVSTITGAGTGMDVVLIGDSSVTTTVNSADFDGNGIVDGKDFLFWQRGQGGAGNHSQGDANSDGQVNAADLTILKTQFGTSPSLGAVAAVPEPSSVFIAFGMLLGARASRRLGQRVAGQRS